MMKRLSFCLVSLFAVLAFCLALPAPALAADGTPLSESYTIYYYNWATHPDDHPDGVIVLQNSPEPDPKYTDAGWWYDVYPASKMSCSAVLYQNRYRINTFEVRDKIVFAGDELDSFFFDCKYLENLNGLQNMDTRQVTGMRRTFKDCEKLGSFDFGCWDYSSLTDASHMFWGAGVKTVSMKNCEFPYLETLDSAFCCENLKEMDMSGSQFPSLKTATDMLRGCWELDTVNMKGCDFSALESANYMFYWDRKLVTLDMSTCKLDSLSDASHMFDECWILESVQLGSDSEQLKSLTDASGMFRCCYKLKQILEPSRLVALKNASHMYEKCTSLDKANLSQNSFNSVEDASSMFAGCTSLTFASLGTNQDGNLQNASKMFSGCTALLSAYLDGSNFASLKDASSMFDGCTALRDISIHKCFTSVENASYMFSGCSALPKVYLASGFPAATSVKGMFNGCTSLALVDMGDWQSSVATDASLMFKDCNSLTAADLSTCAFNDVVYAGEMFSGCSALKSASLGTFGTQNLAKTNSMFLGCSSLEDLDLSGCNLNTVNNSSYMFSGCGNLGTIRTAYDTNLSALSQGASKNMFYGCLNLQGGNGTAYDQSASLDASRAMVDACAASPLGLQVGYFTAGSSVTFKPEFDGASDIVWGGYNPDQAFGALPTGSDFGVEALAGHTAVWKTADDEVVTADTVVGSVDTLYANWNFNVTYDLNYDGISSTDVFNSADGVAELPQPTREGWAFAGWYDNAECTGSKVEAIAAGTTHDVVLYARWAPPASFDVPSVIIQHVYDTPTPESKDVYLALFGKTADGRYEQIRTVHYDAAAVAAGTVTCETVQDQSGQNTTTYTLAEGAHTFADAPDVYGAYLVVAACASKSYSPEIPDGQAVQPNGAVRDAFVFRFHADSDWLKYKVTASQSAIDAGVAQVDVKIDCWRLWDKADGQMYDDMYRVNQLANVALSVQASTSGVANDYPVWVYDTSGTHSYTAASAAAGYKDFVVPADSSQPYYFGIEVVGYTMADGSYLTAQEAEGKLAASIDGGSQAHANPKGDVISYFVYNPNTELFEQQGALNVTVSAAEYKITYHLDGVDVPAETYSYGSEHQLAQPTVTSGVFDGWYTSSDLSGQKITSLPAGTMGDVDLYGRQAEPVATPEPMSWDYDGVEHTGVNMGAGYTLSGETQATDAGVYTATATLKDGYIWADGTREDKDITWNIAPCALPSRCSAALDWTQAAYSGSLKAPGATVTTTIGGQPATLVEGTDYLLEYDDNPTGLGTHTVYVMGKGNYQSVLTLEYVVYQGIDAPSPASGLSYTGAALTGVDAGTGYTLADAAGADEQQAQIDGAGNATSTAAGSYRVVASLQDGYAWLQDDGSLSFDDIELTWDIVPADLSATSIVLDQATFVYDGGACEPGLTVTDAFGNVLAAWDDYFIEYADNVDAGTATVTVTGAGNYTGSASAEFTIAKALPELSAAVAGGPGSYSIGYETSADDTAAVAFAAEQGGDCFSIDPDTGALTLVAATAPGQTASATVTVSGDNYETVSATVRFAIVDDGSGTLVIPETVADFTYGDAGKTVNIAPKDGYTVADVALEQGADAASVAWSAGESACTVTPGSAGTALIKVTYKSQDSSQPDITDWISVFVDPRAASVTADSLSKVYGQVDPELTYTVQGVLDGDSLDVTISRDTGENVGTYAISCVVAANPNYTVTANGATFTIAPAAVPVPVPASGLVYNGAEQTGVAAGSGYSLSGDAAATNARSYTATARLDDPANTQWSDGTTADRNITWRIDRKPIQKPAVNTDLVYNGKAQTGVEAGEGYTLSGTVSATQVGDYTATAALDDAQNTEWADGTTGTLDIAWSIASDVQDYAIIEGADSQYVRGSGSVPVFASNAPFDKFDSVLVDDNVVDPASYRAESGSTRITFDSGYLDSLAAGKHSLVIKSTDGQAGCDFAVAEPDDGNGSDGGDGSNSGSAASSARSTTAGSSGSSGNTSATTAKTGDANPVAAALACALCSAAVATAAHSRRRRA